MSPHEAVKSLPMEDVVEMTTGSGELKRVTEHVVNVSIQ